MMEAAAIFNLLVMLILSLMSCFVFDFVLLDHQQLLLLNHFGSYERFFKSIILNLDVDNRLLLR